MKTFHFFRHVIFVELSLIFLMWKRGKKRECIFVIHIWVFFSIYKT